MKRRFLYVFVAVILCQILHGIALPLQTVATSRTAEGITVMPAQVTLTVSNNAPEAQEALTIVNTYENPVRITAELHAIDESGARLVPSGKIGDSLAKSLSISEREVTVSAHGRASLMLAARDIQELSPGGHYASLLLSEKDMLGNKSTFRAAVAVNVFLVKADGVRRDIKLEEMRTSKSMFKLPSSVELTLYNGGNTHIVPRASVGLYSDDGTLLGKAVANSESRLLFPGRRANFTSGLSYYEKVFWPQHITMLTMYRIDGVDVQLQKYEKFWYVPFIDLLLLLLACTLIWTFRKRLKALPYRRILNRGIRVLWWFVMTLGRLLRKVHVAISRRVPSSKKIADPAKVQTPIVGTAEPGSLRGVSKKVGSDHRIPVIIIDDEQTLEPPVAQEVAAKSDVDTVPIQHTTNEDTPKVRGSHTSSAMKKHKTGATTNIKVKKSEKPTAKKQKDTNSKSNTSIRGKKSKKA